MSIEFLLNEFEEKKKKELAKIDKTLSKKPGKKVSKETIYLRKFTLALLGQYKVKKHHIEKKGKSIDKLNKELSHETNKLNYNIQRPVQKIMPKPPMPVNIPQPVKPQLEIPKPVENKSIPVPL